MFELIEVVKGRLVGSKSCNRSVEIFGTLLVSPYQFRTDLGICIIIYIINCVFVSRRLEMDMEFGSTKRNRCWMSGLPTDSPLALFWDC